MNDLVRRPALVTNRSRSMTLSVSNVLLDVRDRLLVDEAVDRAKHFDVEAHEGVANRQGWELGRHTSSGLARRGGEFERGVVVVNIQRRRAVVTKYRKRSKRLQSRHDGETSNVGEGSYLSW